MSVRERYARLPPLGREARERLREIPALLERHPVRLAYLFGSCARFPEQAEDVDLAILPDAEFNFRAFYADLSEFLGTDRLDLLELPQAPFWLRKEIMEKGICIYEKHSGEQSRWEGAVSVLLREAALRRPSAGEGTARGVNRAFLENALNELGIVAEELRKYRGVSLPDLETNFSLRWTVERGLLAGLTLLFQIADHILAGHFGHRPDTYERLLRELRSCGVISAELYAQLRGAGGFRNILVHEYVRIDPRRVVEMVHAAADVFDAFSRESEAWIAGHGEGLTP